MSNLQQISLQNLIFPQICKGFLPRKILTVNCVSCSCNSRPSLKTSAYNRCKSMTKVAIHYTLSLEPLRENVKLERNRFLLKKLRYCVIDYRIASLQAAQIPCRSTTFPPPGAARRRRAQDKKKTISIKSYS